MRNKSAGFTLLEVLLVLVIFGSILGIGIFSITSLSKTTTLSETTNDVVAILKETQNMAKNNVIPKVEPGPTLSPTDKLNSIYYFGLQFKYNASTPYGSITRVIYRYNTISKTWAIVDTEDNIQTSIAKSNVNYGTQIANGECKYVLFEALTGDVRAFTGTSYTYTNPNNPANLEANNCELTITLVKEQISKKVYINALEGNFGIVGETN